MVVISSYIVVCGMQATTPSSHTWPCMHVLMTHVMVGMYDLMTCIHMDASIVLGHDTNLLTICAEGVLILSCRLQLVLAV